MSLPSPRPFPRRRTRGRAVALGGLAVALAAGSAQVLASTASAAPAGAAISLGAPAAVDSFWTPANAAGAARSMAAAPARARRIEPRSYSAYTLDAARLDGRLATAPDEAAPGATDRASTITVPAPDGSLVRFAVVSSPVMADGLAAAHPEITTYAGRGVDDPTASIRLDVTPMGFHASVRGPGSTSSWYVDPAFNGDDSLYLSYRGSAVPAADEGIVEPDLGAGVEKRLTAEAVTGSTDASRAGEAPGAAVVDRTYRLALITDPSYSRYFGAQNVLAEKVTLMNRVNQIYNDDLAMRLQLIDQTDALSFDTLAEATKAGGPCGPVACYTKAQITQGCGVSLLFANRIVLGEIIGASNYDIGHIALGINGGGIAGLGVVGGKGKAWGCTGLPQPEGDFMAIDYVAHEMGHQVGGPHTFNGVRINCGGFNRTGRTSVEPGSGSSVMAYAGICGTDDLQPHTDPYFSEESLTDISSTVTAERTPIDETQVVALGGYDTDGASYRLSYDGATTRPIVRGRNDTAAGVKAALDAALAPSTVTVRRVAGRGEISDHGYLVTFVGGPLAATDVASLDVVQASPGVTGVVSEVDQGGPRRNGGNTAVVSGNHAPIVQAPADRTIPKQTPFGLRGSATDADGNPLVYTWEQNDRGGVTGTGLIDQTKTDGPLFRMFGRSATVTPAGTLQYGSPGENLADANPTRIFPDIAQVLAGNTNAQTGQCPSPGQAGSTRASRVECFSEWLPTPDYVGSPAAGNARPSSLDFRLTARDLDPEAGGTSYDDVTLTVDRRAGPFLVSSKGSPGAAAVIGRTEDLFWEVAGTRRLAKFVTISLSTDGGRTYPTVLARRVPNDGTQAVTWPDKPTTQGRIKIQAVDNYFFDLSDTDLTLSRPQR